MDWSQFPDHWDELDLLFEQRPQRQLARDLEWDVSNLSQQLAAHASIAAYWGGLLVAAQDHVDELKAAHDINLAEIRDEKRGFALNTSLKITAQHLEDQVLKDSRSKACQESMQNAVTRLNTYKMAVKALDQKLQSMIAVAANERAQLRGIDPVFRPTPDVPYNPSQGAPVPSPPTRPWPVRKRSEHVSSNGT